MLRGSCSGDPVEQSEGKIKKKKLSYMVIRYPIWSLARRINNKTGRNILLSRRFNPKNKQQGPTPLTFFTRYSNQYCQIVQIIL